MRIKPFFRSKVKGTRQKPGSFYFILVISLESEKKVRQKSLFSLFLLLYFDLTRILQMAVYSRMATDTVDGEHR